MKKFIKGSSILIIGDFLTKVISILYLVPLKQINSQIILLMTNLLIPFGFFIVLTTFGTSVIFTNELVRAKTDERKKEVLIDVGIIVTLLTIVGCILMIWLSPIMMNIIEVDPKSIEVLINGSYILTIGVILFAVSSYLRSFYMAEGEYKIISYTFISEQLLRVGLILLLSYYMFYINNFNVVYSVYIIVFSIMISMLSTVIAFVWKLKHGKYYLKFKGTYVFKSKNFKYLIITSLIFFMSSIYITLFDQIDLLLMSQQMLAHGFSIGEIDQVKSEYFTLSMKIVMVPITISTAFISVMIKYLGDQVTNKVKEFYKVIIVALIYSSIMLGGILVFGPLAYKILYREPTLGIIRIQALIIPFYIIKNIISGYVLTNDGRKITIIYSAIIIIVLKVILDIALFSILAYYGYIVASIIALTVGTCYTVLSNKKMFMIQNK